jgi:hypothetical protein
VVTYDHEIERFSKKQPLLQEGIVDAVSFWIAGPNQRTQFGNLSAHVARLRQLIGPARPLFTGGYVTYSSIGWTQPGPFYSILDASVEMYDAGTVDGFYVFAGSVLAHMNHSLWQTWALPAHLDRCVQPWLGTAVVTVVDAKTQQPIADAVATVTLRGSHVARKNTSAAGRFQFGGWVGKAAPLAHTVAVVAEGYEAVSATVQLRPQAVTNATVVMRLLRDAAATSGAARGDPPRKDDGTPYWAGPRPNASAGPAHGLPPVSGAATHRVYSGVRAIGTYSHGPIVTWWAGRYYVTWYNAPRDEGSEQRVLLAASRDGRAWSPPKVLFSNITKEGSTYGTQNEAYCQRGGRLYGVASAYDFCDRAAPYAWSSSCLGSAPHFQGPYALMMRRIRSPGQFGKIFWLQRAAPAGYARWGFPTYLQLPDQFTRDDAAAHLAGLVNTTVPSMETNDTDHVSGVSYALTYQGERSLYRMPGDASQLQLLIRSWKRDPWDVARSSRGFLWTSSCSLPAEEGVIEADTTNRTMGWCAPGTGANMLQVVDGDGGQLARGRLATRSGARNCTWSEVRETNIPDANSRTCAAGLPSDFVDPHSQRRGGVWVIANSAESRLTLVFSVSSDGMAFDRHWIVRDSATALPVRYPGGGKSPGFQYPVSHASVPRLSLSAARRLC